jgi:hypothetical protein
MQREGHSRRPASVTRTMCRAAMHGETVRHNLQTADVNFEVDPGSMAQKGWKLI